MTTMRTLLAGLLLAAGAVLALPGTAHACSCVAAGPRQYVEWADAVVWAEVVEVDRPSPPIGEAHYLLEVDRVYRGEVTRSAQVNSNVSSASCGLQGIESGRSYAFFLEGDRSPYSATLCGGSGAVDRETLERVLGAGASGPALPGSGEPVGYAPDPGGPTGLPVSAWSWAGVGAGVFAVVVGSGLWALRLRHAARPA